MVEVVIEQKKKRDIYLVPSEWNEVKGEALVEIAELLYSQEYKDYLDLVQEYVVSTGSTTNAETNEDEKFDWEQALNEIQRLYVKFKFEVLFIFLKGQNTNMRTYRAFRRLITPEQFVDLLKLTDFIFKEIKLTKLDLGELLPEGYAGPGEDFGNLILNEMVFAPQFYKGWHSTKKDYHLDMLCAVLFRVKGHPPTPFKGGLPTLQAQAAADDARIPFDMYDVENNCVEIAKWDRKIKLAALLWFEGCSRLMKEQFPNTHEHTDDAAKEDRNPAEMVLSLAGPKFGTVDETGRTRYVTILIFIEMQLKEINKKAA